MNVRLKFDGVMNVAVPAPKHNNNFHTKCIKIVQIINKARLRYWVHRSNSKYRSKIQSRKQKQKCGMKRKKQKNVKNNVDL